MATIEVMPKPYFLRNRATFYQGDVLNVLREMPSESVHCCVTSPPYWGLRDYGVAGQIGLEATPEEYTARMVEVFREVRRVLRSDGTCWVNLGDSYNAGTSARRQKSPNNDVGYWQQGGTMGDERIDCPSLKPKDMVGIPWRVAFALQADGWWLRSDIIWAKPNPMPESVTDRPTKSHEYLFLLSKSPRYYYDAEAVREIADPSNWRDSNTARRAYDESQTDHGFQNGRHYSYRNLRDVWTIATQPTPMAHFATFPEALVEPCIKAGCPEGGTVLDPFAGSGTTLLVAQKLGRCGVGIELSPEYADIAARRLTQEVLAL